MQIYCGGDPDSKHQQVAKTVGSLGGADAL